jgi:hypothetical protein
LFPTVSDLIPVLQTAIGPVILISGVGLLLLTMTNRLGRVIDRARSLASQLASAAPAQNVHKSAQLAILWKRARLVRAAITLTALSALFAALLVVILFVTALFGLDDAWLIGLLFVMDMACLIFGLVYFLQDVNLSLEALRLELQDLPPSTFPPSC